MLRSTNIGELPITSKAVWIYFRELSEGKHKTTINYKFSTDSAYPEGKLMKIWDKTPSDTDDILFKIISISEPVPGMCKASEAELKTLPSPEFADLQWNSKR